MQNALSQTAPKITLGEQHFFQDRIMKPITHTQRFILWVDAVGGYFVCLQDVITLGQAIAGSTVDIPLLGDVSRNHARIRRIDDQYILEPISTVRVRGSEITTETPLHNGDQIQFGNVELLFHKPHPLSATAKLEFTTGHRTHPRTDGILLMADSLIIGNRNHDHVVYPYDEHQIVLYRSEQGVACRSDQPIDLDEKHEQSVGPVFLGSKIKSDYISLGIEAL
ncbi:MAG: FHA domain-containing protein [Planctomycetaceae bacterium]|nr:FHA domain-containing protein [Planctomycetaceae bacterium]